MALHYHSGELITTGDKVMFHGTPAVIEFIADPSTAPTDLILLTTTNSE